MDEAINKERKDQEEHVQEELSCIKVGHGHVHHQENVHPCCFAPSFVSIIQREVGDEAGD
jgi:hypothetical protein